MINDAELQAWRESLSASDAQIMANTYRAAAADPNIARPGDTELAEVYQNIADRKRG